MDKIKVVVKINKFKFDEEHQEFYVKITVKIYSPNKHLPRTCWSKKDIMYERLNDSWGEYNENGEEKWRETTTHLRNADIENLQREVEERIKGIVETLRSVIGNNRKNNAEAAKTTETIREYYL